jgi:hypothetical protein
MRRFVALLTVLAFALSTTVPYVPARAQTEDTSLRFYFKIPLGGGETRSLAERSNFGFQFHRDLGFNGRNLDFSPNGTAPWAGGQQFHWQSATPVFDFSFNSEGLTGMKFMGIDALSMTRRQGFLYNDEWFYDPGWWIVKAALLAGILLIVLDDNDKDKAAAKQGGGGNGGENGNDDDDNSDSNPL